MGSPEQVRGRPSGSAAETPLLRVLFYFLWLFALPLGLALLGVWALSPEDPVGASGLRTFVHAQPIPTGIVLFTISILIIWRFRHDLPLSGAISVGRQDIPASARARYEDASALLEEARRILRIYKRQIDREITVTEREQLEQALGSLEQAMAAAPFDPKAFDGAHARADRHVGEHLARWRKGEMREYAESIGVAVAVALLLRVFVLEAFKIPSGSMIPTLMIGDHIFVNKFAYGPLIPWTTKRLLSNLPPKRADVMVFKFPENVEQDFIKRVIAVPGDTLEVIDGRPIINGWLVPHCYVGTYRYEGRSTELYIEYLEDKSYFTLFERPPGDRACSSVEDCGLGLSCRGGICGMLQGPFKVARGEAWVMGDNRNNSHDSRTWRGGIGGGVPFQNIKGRAMFVWMSFGQGDGIASDRLFVSVTGRPHVPAGQDPALYQGLERCLRDRPAVSQTTPPPGRQP